MSESSKRYGKYKAYVVNIADPQMRGRIQVACPKIMGQGKSAWCEPCVPVAYDNGGDFFLPKLGDTVWIEFEEGNPTRPIWVGNWWSANKTPVADYSTSGLVRVIEFDGTRIEMQKGQVKIRVSDTAFVTINETVGVTLSGATINLNGGA